jgi:polyhydroxyalkanoate synthase
VAPCQPPTATLNPDKISHLVLTVSPIDFDAYKANHKPHEGLMFTMGADADVEKMVAVHGNVPATVLNESFMMASPFILNYGKYADVIDILDDRLALQNFLRMEKWLFGGPDAVGQMFKEFIRDFLKGNKLVKGTLEVGGRKVDLKELTIPILNIFAEKDHIVPPPCTVALGKHVGSKDYTEFAIATGHIGIYTGGLAQKVLAPKVASWMRERGA